MSAAVRRMVVSAFGAIDDSQAADLLDEESTTTELIEFLRELFTVRDGIWVGRLVCTAVRTDHPTYDGPDGHSGGNAIDFAQLTNDASEHLIQDVQACSQAKGIGLGGPYQLYADACGGYSPESKLFMDNATDHLHVQVVGY